jgi:hypothetical protein
VWTTTKKTLSLCSTRKSQGKQKGEENRIKIDKNSYKNSDKNSESILKKLEEIGFLAELWVRILKLNILC